MNQSGEEHASKIKEKEGIYDIFDEHLPERYTLGLGRMKFLSSSFKGNSAGESFGMLTASFTFPLMNIHSCKGKPRTR